MQFALTSRDSPMSSKSLVIVVRRSGKFKFIECDDPSHTVCNVIYVGVRIEVTSESLFMKDQQVHRKQYLKDGSISMVLPAARSFESTLSSTSSFSRSSASGDHATSRTKFGSVLMVGTFFVFASIIAPLREWQFLDAEDSRRTASIEAATEGIPQNFRDPVSTTSITSDISMATANALTNTEPSDQESPVIQPDEDSAKSESIPLARPSNATISQPNSAADTPLLIPTLTPLRLKRNFSGIIARPFSPWPSNLPLPCFPAEVDWADTSTQFTPAKQGFLYLKPYKTGSSTTSGVNLRIARNVARRRTDLQNVNICKTRFDHGPDFTPGYTLFTKRNPTESFLWTILRDPTSRAVSQFFHFEVSRQKLEPTDANFKSFLRQKNPMQDYYLRALFNRGKFSRERYHPVRVANNILRNYNFIGITERLNESLVALMMQLNLKIADILYLSAKGRGGYDDAGGPKHQCTYIWPSFLSPGMKAYFQTDEWKDTTKYDRLLYQAVNRSLDMTIDRLGREAFNENLAKFVHAQEQAKIQCLPSTIFPCDLAGRVRDDKETDCIWKDSGCGSTCLDQIATDLNLW
jgi:Sulfotransferase family